MEQSVRWGTTRVVSSAYLTRRFIRDNVFSILAKSISRYGPTLEPWTILLVISRKADFTSSFLTFLNFPGREGGKGVFFFSYSNSYFAVVLREVYYKTIIIFLYYRVAS